MRLTVLTVSLSATLFAAACGTSETTTDEGWGVGTPENPVPSTKTGAYKVVNTIDFTAEAILPPQGELIVSTLREFSTNPAHALINIASLAGVPAVDTLYGLLPGALKDRFEGWVNDEINKVKVNGRPLTEYAAEVVSYADIALTQFAVDSELTLDSGTVTHRLTGLDLHPAGIDFRLPIGGLAGDILTQNPELTVLEGGQLSFGEQKFGLNYGDYAWQGVEAASTAVFGAGVRATLGNAVNCPNVAHNIADKCVLGVCVGHESLINDICNGGLDAIVNFAHDRFMALNMDALVFSSGNARLVDDDADGVGDRIVDGTWEAQLNLGLGLRHAPASFAGAR